VKGVEQKKDRQNLSLDEPVVMIENVIKEAKQKRTRIEERLNNRK
jgi:hypothetical protein